MPSLLDTIDRLTYTANSLHSTAASSKPDNIGPFTQAMLHSSLQDIIREADETEYELFHFATCQDDLPALGPGKLGRREYKAATPLRARRGAGKAKDEEPEVYLEAALRYLDRFHSIKPMSGLRAHLESLVERLDDVRSQVEEVQNAMQETGRRVPPTIQIKEEERAIDELKDQILQLKKKKNALNNAVSLTAPRARSVIKTIAGSYSNPPRSRKSPPKPEKVISSQSTEPNPQSFSLSNNYEHSPILKSAVNDRDEPTTAVSSQLDDDLVCCLQNEPIREPIRAPVPSTTQSQLPDLIQDPQIPFTSIQRKRIADSPSKSEHGGLHITTEMERICAKIWDTIADLLIPGNHFAHGRNVPNAKDTITILERISSYVISDSNSTINSQISSPSTPSTLSSILGIEIHPLPAGTAHQILTALVLLTLLMSPNHSIPLNVLKAQLASRAEFKSSSTSGMSKETSIRPTDFGSRAIYGCVAKKLIKIDRRGGEQVVKFEY